MRAPEKCFNLKLKFNEISICKQRHTVNPNQIFPPQLQLGQNIARVEVTEIFNISPAIHLTAYPEPQNVNNYTIFDGMPRYYRVNYLQHMITISFRRGCQCELKYIFLIFRPISNIKIIVTKSNQCIHIKLYYMNMYSLVKQTCL